MCVCEKMSQKRGSAVKIFMPNLLLKNFGRTKTETEKTEIEFAGPVFFRMKFSPKFSKTEMTERP